MFPLRSWPRCQPTAPANTITISTGCPRETREGVFGDTFYWIALILPGDAAHTRARQVADDVVTTEEVLTEYLTFFSAAPEYLRRQVATNVEAILSDSTVRVVPQCHACFLAGLDYSLTDCISMETMRKEGLTEALINDRHFEWEGFRALWRPELPKLRRSVGMSSRRAWTPS